VRHGYYLFGYAAIGFGVALLGVVGAELFALAKNRLNTSRDFWVVSLWQVGLAAGLSICAALAGAMRPPDTTADEDENMDKDENFIGAWDKAQRALSDAVAAALKFDNATSPRQMNEAEQEEAKQALEKLGQFLQRWKFDPRTIEPTRIFSEPVHPHKRKR